MCVLYEKRGKSPLPFWQRARLAEGGKNGNHFWRAGLPSFFVGASGFYALDQQKRKDPNSPFNPCVALVSAFIVLDLSFITNRTCDIRKVLTF